VAFEGEGEGREISYFQLKSGATKNARSWCEDWGEKRGRGKIPFPSPSRHVGGGENTLERGGRKEEKRRKAFFGLIPVGEKKKGRRGCGFLSSSVGKGSRKKRRRSLGRKGRRKEKGGDPQCITFSHDHPGKGKERGGEPSLAHCLYEGERGKRNKKKREAPREEERKKKGLVQPEESLSVKEKEKKKRKKRGERKGR